MEELRAYFGFMVLMDVVSLPAMDDYWRRDPLLHYSPIADRTSRDRFRDIHHFLHFADNSSLPKRAIRSLGQIQAFHGEAAGEIHRGVPATLRIDEAMIPFQGRSTLMKNFIN